MERICNNKIVATPVSISVHLHVLTKGTVEFHWHEHLWNHEIMFQTEVVRANEWLSSARSGGIIGISLDEAILVKTHNIRFQLIKENHPKLS